MRRPRTACNPVLAKQIQEICLELRRNYNPWAHMYGKQKLPTLTQLISYRAAPRVQQASQYQAQLYAWAYQQMMGGF